MSELSYNDEPSTEAVKKFWEDNPLCQSENPYELGSEEFFCFYDLQREEIESQAFSYNLHEYSEFCNKRVLDVGCGNGYVLSKYAKYGANVFGIDITDQAIEISKDRFGLAGLKGRFKRGDAQDLPYANDFFDLVCSMGVLHHVPDTQKSVNEIFRVLKPGGKFISMFYHRRSARYHIYFKVRSIVKKVPLTQVVNENDGIGNPKAATFSKTEVMQLLSNFENLRLDVDYLPTRDIVLKGSNYLPKNLFKPLAKYFGWNLYAKSNKPVR